MESLAPGATPRLMTADELLRLQDDDWRYELVDGRLIQMAPTGGEHSSIVINLLLALASFVRNGNLGVVFAPETGFWISRAGQRDTVLAPDLAFVGREKAAATRVKGFPRVTPNLVVEVVSPSQTRPEMAAKAQRWLEAGAELVWVIWPESCSVDIWRHGEAVRTVTAGEDLDGESVVPGFRYPVEGLFS